MTAYAFARNPDVPDSGARFAPRPFARRARVDLPRRRDRSRASLFASYLQLKDALRSGEAGSGDHDARSNIARALAFDGGGPAAMRRLAPAPPRVIQLEDRETAESRWTDFEARQEKRTLAVGRRLVARVEELKGLEKRLKERPQDGELRTAFLAALGGAEQLKRERDILRDAGSKARAWFDKRKSEDTPDHRRELRETDLDELYDRFFQDVLLARPIPDSLGKINEELRGLYLRLEELQAQDPTPPEAEAYWERIAQLTDELRKQGVTADDDTIWELVTTSPEFRDEKLYRGARIRRTPPGELKFGERIYFRVEPFYLPPGSLLEVEWRWRSLKSARLVPFAGQPLGRTPRTTLILDESFWGWMPGPVRDERGFQAVARLYLDGEFVRTLTSEWVPLSEGLPDDVQVSAHPRRTFAGAPVSFRLTRWTPYGMDYFARWQVNGEAVQGGPLSYSTAFDEPGRYSVVASIHGSDPGSRRPIYTTDATTVDIAPAEELGRQAIELFRQQGLPGLATLGPGLGKTLKVLEEKVAAGGDEEAYWERRLEAQKTRQEFLEREVPDVTTVQPLDKLGDRPAVGSRFSAPVPAILLHAGIGKPVPLTLYLVLHRAAEDRWQVQLLDLTGSTPLSYPGHGATPGAAVAIAVADWMISHTYPAGGTVTFSCPHWAGTDHFGTRNLKTTALEVADQVLLVGGLITSAALLATPDVTGGTKVAALTLMAASIARSSYAIYENIRLGIPWYDTRNVLEALSIVGSVVGVGGGTLRAAGKSGTGLYRTGTALVMFGLGTDVGTVVVLSYQGYAAMRAIGDDPTLDDAQKTLQMVRIASTLLLSGLMTFVSNRDLFKSPKGSLAGQALDPSQEGALGRRARLAMELEVKRHGQGKRLRGADGKPVTDRALFELFYEVRASKERLTDVQASLGSERARREFGRFLRSKRQTQAVDAGTARRLGRAFEVPVHLDPDLPPGSVRVAYELDGLRLRKLGVRVGPDTAVADVLRHAPTVQLLKSYRGLAGRMRLRVDRLRAIFGNAPPSLADGLAFEAWEELRKLPSLLELRHRRLRGKDLSADDRIALEREVDRLYRALDEHLPRVEGFAKSQRRGFIASDVSSDLPPHLHTVEERWRLGRPLPPSVLAEPDAWLFNTRTQLWENLPEPHLGGSKTKSRPPWADDDGYFLFSWEQEGLSDDIFLYFRPTDRSAVDWYAEGLRPGKTRKDLVAALDPGSSKTLEEITAGVKELVDPGRLASYARGEELGKTDFVKTQLAHPKMADTLATAGNPTVDWEVTHRAFELDPNRVFGKQGQVEWLATQLGNQGFHFHVSFPRTSDPEHIGRLMALLAHLNNYEALRSYRYQAMPKYDPKVHNSPISGRVLGVMSAEQLAEIETLLLQGNQNQTALKNLDTHFKWHFVALRRSAYRDAGDRIGLEFRIYHGQEGSYPTQKLIHQTIDLLKNPHRKFHLGSEKKTYSLEELRAAGLVPSLTTLQEAEVPAALREFLKTAAERAPQRPTVWSPTGQLLVRWSVPFVDWKKHPAIPKSAHDVIDNARKFLIKDLQAIARGHSIAKPGDTTAKTIQEEIQKAIADWALATDLWRYF